MTTNYTDLVVITAVKNGKRSITHISQRYLSELSIVDKEEYARSICMTTFDGEYFDPSETGFAKVTGKSIFLHPRTKRSACIRFIAHCMKIEEDYCVYYTCIFGIMWKHSEPVADIMSRVRNCETRREVKKYGTRYIACPSIFIFGDMNPGARKLAKDSLECEGCLFSVNVGYPVKDQPGFSVTRRCLLVPRALFDSKEHAEGNIGTPLLTL